jgi:hypothetical protein
MPAIKEMSQYLPELGMMVRPDYHQATEPVELGLNKKSPTPVAKFREGGRLLSSVFETLNGPRINSD